MIGGRKRMGKVAVLGIVGLAALMAACAGEELPAPEPAEPGAPVLAAPAGTDWSTCRFQNLQLPVPGRLFVVGAGAPLDDSEPGRATIRRVAGMVAGEESPAPARAEPGAPVLAAPAGTDWSTCRFQSRQLPVPGRLFVVDAGAPLDDSEPGRETIRRVDVMVPGQVSLLLTASHATAWHVRAWPETEIVAIFASGQGGQRITGTGLGDHRMERSQDFGD